MTALEVAGPAPAQEPPVVYLSPMLWDVLVELCRDGAPNGEIGRRLFRSEDTIKTHMRRLLALCGARDRTHLVVLLMRREIVVQPDRRERLGRPRGPLSEAAAKLARAPRSAPFRR